MQESTAYDDLKKDLRNDQLSEYRRILISNNGTISNGNLCTGLTLGRVKRPSNSFYYQPPDDPSPTMETEPVQYPDSIFQRIGSRNIPGLIFNKSSFQNIIKQIETRGELSIGDYINQLAFTNQSYVSLWEQTPDNIKKRCILRNLNTLVKETRQQYLIYGDRMHYLTVGLITADHNIEGLKRFPLLLFSCQNLDLSTFKARIDQSGLLNFWFDKNILNDKILQRTKGNYEVALDSDFTSKLNSFATWLNSLNVFHEDYRSINVDPSYISLQIISGFEAEYIDPAWKNILQEEK